MTTNHEHIPHPSTLYTRAGRQVTAGMNPDEYPATAACQVCYEKIICADHTADWSSDQRIFDRYIPVHSIGHGSRVKVPSQYYLGEVISVPEAHPQHRVEVRWYDWTGRYCTGWFDFDQLEKA